MRGDYLELNYHTLRTTNWRGPPHPGFDISGLLDTVEPGPLVLLSAWCRIRVCVEKAGGLSVFLHSAIPLQTVDPVIQGGRRRTADLGLTLDPVAIAEIERMRKGANGVFIELAFTATVAPIEGTRESLHSGLPRRALIGIDGEHHGNQGFRIERDEWLKLLQRMGFSNMQVFELPIFQHPALPEMQKAIDALRGAEQAMGLGDWAGVMSKTRAAFEAVATLSGKSKNVKAGFEKFWQNAFPNENDAELRDALDRIVGSLAELQNLGRHTRHPFPDIQRPEALLALRQTLALFEYVGQRMKQQGA